MSHKVLTGEVLNTQGLQLSQQRNRGFWHGNVVLDLECLNVKVVCSVTASGSSYPARQQHMPQGQNHHEVFLTSVKQVAWSFIIFLQKQCSWCKVWLGLSWFAKKKLFEERELILLWSCKIVTMKWMDYWNWEISNYLLRTASSYSVRFVLLLLTNEQQFPAGLWCWQEWT